MTTTPPEFREAHPANCTNGHDWGPPGSHLPGWDSGVCTGGPGHRIWTCATCGDVVHREEHNPIFDGGGHVSGE